MRYKATLVATLLLAACGGQSGNEQAGGNEAGNGAAAAGSGGDGGGAASIALQPGQWETTVEVTRLSVSNMPQGITPPTPPPTTASYCLTAEQAARPSAGFLTGGGEAGGCSYENFSMANGQLSGAVTCNVAGTSSRSTFSGQFTPTSYEMTTQVEATAAGMTTESETRTTARRVGECPSG